MDFYLPCLVAVGLFLCGTAVAAPGTPGELFERTLIGPEGLDVRVRPEALDLKPGGSVRLNVRTDAEPYEGYVTSVSDTRLGSHVLRGRIKDTPSGNFLVVTHGTATAASVWVSPTERYTFGGKTLREEPAVSQVRCACAADPARTERQALLPSTAAAVRTTATAAAPLEFDVLVVYTPAALAAEGDAYAVAVQADLAMADANVCYQNSGIPIHGNIVAVRPVDYAESGEIITDLDRLDTPGNGYFNEVPAMRDEVEADFVCLFTGLDSADGFAGRADVLTGLSPEYETYGFSVVNVKQAVVDHLFAHELGHNMGCDHDRENSMGYHLYDFSYGWRFTGTDGVLYRDVMAYPPGASIPYFSTPLIAYAGVPTGVADYADTARTIIASAPTFVNFRPADGRPLVSVISALLSPVDLATAQPLLWFERTGSTAAPLTVSYTTGGTAVAGTTYHALPGTVTFPAGEHFATQTAHVKKSAPPFGVATVVITLTPSDGYVPAVDQTVPPFGPTATLPLFDRLPLLKLFPTGKATPDGLHVKFFVYRLGHLDNELALTFGMVGTAQLGVDYTLPNRRIIFAPGHAKATVKIRLLAPAVTPPTGERTIGVQIYSDAGGYNVAAPGTATFSW